MKKVLLLLILSFTFRALQAQDYWEPVKGLYGADAQDVRYDQDGTIYLATEASGVYKSTNNGKTWVGAYGNLEYDCVQSLSISAAGDLFVARSYYGEIYRSSDKGNTWVDAGLNLSSVPYYARIFSVQGDIFINASPAGLYKLSKNGSQWIAANGISGGSVNSMCSSGSYLIAGTDGGLYRSSDRGNSWIVVGNSSSNKSVQSIASDRSGNIYLSTYSLTLISSDNGMTWKEIYSSGFRSLITDSEGILYGVKEGTGIYQSTNKGNTWTLVYSSSYVNGKIDVNSNNDVIATTDVGPVMSLDRGKTWTLSVEGLRANSIDVLYGLPDGTIFAGNEMGLYRTTDYSASWKNVIPCENYHSPTAMNKNSKGNLFALLNFKMYMSTDKGENWSGYKVNNTNNDWEEIVFLNDTVFIGHATKGVVKSYNFSKWTEVNNGLPYWTGTQIDVRNMLVAKNNVILGGCCDDGVFRTSDGGKSWVRSDKGIEHVWVLDFLMRHDVMYFDNMPGAASYHDGDIFAATTSGCGSYGRGIYRSTDNGLTWQLKSVGLKTKRFSSIILTNTGVLYTGAFGSEGHGAYRSTDNGESWVLLPSTGLTKKSIRVLLMGGDGRLYAGISGNSLFRTKASFTSAEDQQAIPELYDACVSPNPAVDRCNLTINLKEPATMRIALYGVDGRLIEELGNGYHDAGVVSIPVLKGSMAPGTYFISIDSEKKMQTIKVIFE